MGGELFRPQTKGEAGCLRWESSFLHLFDAHAGHTKTLSLEQLAEPPTRSGFDNLAVAQEWKVPARR